MSTFRNRFQESESDQQIAAGAAHNRAMYCKADGCRALWSVDGPMGKCCSAHAWKPTSEWPRITREVNDIITDIAATPKDERYTPEGDSDRTPLDFKNDPLARTLGELLKPGQSNAMFTGSTAWAYALKRCDEAGMKITPAQREAYQAVVARESIV